MEKSNIKYEEYNFNITPIPEILDLFIMVIGM